MASRVLQLDAHRLDGELISILMDECNSVLSCSPPHIRHIIAAHVKPLIPLAVSLASLMFCGSTPGMDALGLKFAAVENNTAMKSLLKALSLFSLLQVVLPAVWTKLHRLAATQRWNRLSAGPLQKHAWTVMLHADKAAAAASLVNMIVFLYNGRYPSLAHRLTGHLLSHVEPNQARHVNFEYLNQQLIWGELQQFIMFLLPLVTPGSAASNPALTGLIDPVVKFMAGSEASVKQRSRSSKDKCCMCGTEHILVAVETKCCASRCCYMCAQRHKHLAARPYCPSCGAAFEEVFLQPIVLASPEGDWKPAAHDEIPSE